MAVRLRLRRMGKKKQPYYRIVAIDSRSARGGKYLDNLGTYNPRSEPMTLQIIEERALYWLNQGAKPSDTVRTLLSRKGILLRRHLKNRGADDAKIHEEMQKLEALQADKQRRHQAARAQRKLKAKEKPTESTAAEAVTTAPTPVEPASESSATSGDESSSA